jgi:hypothetical protein
MVEDVLNTSGEELLAEVAEDYNGDPNVLAAEFDLIADHIISSRSGVTVKKRSADASQGKRVDLLRFGLRHIRRSRGVRRPPHLSPELTERTPQVRQKHKESFRRPAVSKQTGWHQIGRFAEPVIRGNGSISQNRSVAKVCAQFRWLRTFCHMSLMWPGYIVFRRFVPPFPIVLLLITTIIIIAQHEQILKLSEHCPCFERVFGGYQLANKLKCENEDQYVPLYGKYVEGNLQI